MAERARHLPGPSGQIQLGAFWDAKLASAVTANTSRPFTIRASLTGRAWLKSN